MLLELGCWSEQRVVVLRQDSEPRWQDEEVFLRDNDTSMDEKCDKWNRDAAAIEKEETRSRSSLYSMVPHDYLKGNQVSNPSSHLSPASRYDCLKTLLATSLRQNAEMLIPREWNVEGDKMQHVVGLDVLVPQVIPPRFTVRLEKPDDLIQRKARILAAVLRLCTQRASIMDFDRPYQSMIKVFDYPNNSVYFGSPTDWAMLCRHVEGWLSYYRTTFKRR